MQSQAVLAGGVPPQVVPPGGDIVVPDQPEMALWYIPEGAPLPDPEAGPPVMNGVPQDYEGEHVAALHAAWDAFNISSDDELLG